MKTTLRNEHGAIAVMVAVMLVALIGTLAVVADIGMLYQQRRQLQTAVDAASLAAVMELAEGRGSSAAQTVATGYVEDNKGTTAAVSTTVSFPTPTTVRVAATVNRSLFFANVFGRSTQDVGARATASYATAASVRDLVPIAVPEHFVDEHTGPDNAGTFVFGQDRPVEPFTKTSATEGSTITFTITFINDKGKTINLTIRDPLPSNLTYVQGSADQGGTYCSSSKTITWVFNGLADGDSRTVTFRATQAKTKCTSGKNVAYAYVCGYPTQSATADSASPQLGFFWLADLENAGNTGLPKYDEWIRSGYPNPVEIGFLQNGPGMKSGLKGAVQWRMDNHPKVLVPLFDYTAYEGRNGVYHVVGFAEFYITGNNIQSNNKSITGYFTTGTVVSGSPEGGGGTPSDHGARVVRLDH